MQHKIYYFILLIVLYIYIYYKYKTKNIQIINNNNFPNSLSLLNFQFINFEKKMSHKYPLANDFFNISHGTNYFNFFNNLGYFNYYYQLDKKSGLVNATACSILREINGIKTWYICDLKVDELARGKQFSYKTLLKGLFTSYSKSNKCFAVCMQPNNPIDKLINKLYYPKIKPTCKINIYLLNYKDVVSNLKNIINYFGSGIEIKSNMGIKDIILESTKKPLKVYHIAKSESKSFHLHPEFKYFLTLIDNHDDLYNLNNIFKNNLFGSAIIYSYNMENFDWKYLSSAEI